MEREAQAHAVAMAKPTLVLAMNAGSSSLKAALFFFRGGADRLPPPPPPTAGSAAAEERLVLLASASVSGIGSERGAKAKVASYPPPPSLLASCGAAEEEVGGGGERGGRGGRPYPGAPKEFSDAGAKSLADHRAALEEVLHLLFDHEESTLGPVAGLTRAAVTHAAHRVVHGGSLFPGPVELTADRVRELHALTALAPLHNAPAECIIRIACSSLARARHFAFFDTSFHASLPEEVYTYPLPLEACRKRKIRKYGFHGLSYSFVAKCVELHLRRAEFHRQRLVILHLGSGASACAVMGGASVETTMGYTPVDGLMMATRPGTVDPTAVLHLFDDVRCATEPVRAAESSKNKSNSDSVQNVLQPPLTRLENLLNHDCGFKGIAGSSNIEEVAQAAKRECEDGGGERTPKSPEALAVAMFAHRLRLVIGGYAAVLGGLDALVFTGGSGAKWVDARVMVCRGLEFLGVRLDEKKNRDGKVGDGRGVVWDVTAEGDPAAPRVLVVETDEEREMAEGVLDLVAQAAG